MANAYKVLGQVAPDATTDTTLYTVPSSTETVISTIVVANRSANDTTYDIAIRPNGDTLSNEHYIAKNVAVGASDSTTITLGLTLGAADVVTVQASTTALSFNIFGSEITA
jgi:hypothetical protein